MTQNLSQPIEKRSAIKKRRPRAWQWTKTDKAKAVFNVSRWLHIYFSSALFSLLLFFCITGITLNHAHWFSGKNSAANNTQNKIIVLPTSLQSELMNSETPELQPLQHFIEMHTGLRKPRSIDMDLEMGEIAFDYPLPAGYAFVTVLIEDGEIDVEHKQGSLVTLLNDLHKGRHSGDAWSWVIDISAALISLFSITGIIILLQLGKRRNEALWLLTTGTLTPLFIYWLWVPKLV